MQFEAIGTIWHINFFSDMTNSTSIKNNILQICEDFEKKYSRFDKSSFISILNNSKRLLDPSDEFIFLLNYSQEISKITDNHFSIFAGSFLEALGYDSSYSFQINHANLNSVKNILQKRNLCNQIVINTKLIEIKDNRLSVDLGGIGKGYLINKIKEYLLLQNIKYFWINAGGDIYCTSNYEQPVIFYLENPLNEKQCIGQIAIKNASIAASSNNKRHWKSENIDCGHLIELKKIKNTKQIVGVFTYSLNGLSSDAASTAIFVSPSSYWDRISHQLKVEYMVIYHDGTFTKTKNYLCDLYR